MFPHSIDFTKVTTDDLLHQATTDIIKLLTIPLTDTGPILEASDETRNAPLKVAQLLNRTDNMPKSLPPPQKKIVSPPRVQISSNKTAAHPRVLKNVIF